MNDETKTNKKSICLCAGCREMLYEGDELVQQCVYKLGRLSYIELGHKNCCPNFDNINPIKDINYSKSYAQMREIETSKLSSNMSVTLGQAMTDEFNLAKHKLSDPQSGHELPCTCPICKPFYKVTKSMTKYMNEHLGEPNSIKRKNILEMCSKLSLIHPFDHFSEAMKRNLSSMKTDGRFPADILRQTGRTTLICLDAIWRISDQKLEYIFVSGLRNTRNQIVLQRMRMFKEKLNLDIKLQLRPESFIGFSANHIVISDHI